MGGIQKFQIGILSPWTFDAEADEFDGRPETEKLAMDEQIYLSIKASHIGAIFPWSEKLQHKSKTKRIPPSSR